jgi:hypothetical protein
MPLKIHALMQNANNQNAVWRRNVEYHMSALPDPAQLRHNLFCALPKMGIIEQGRKTGFQLAQIFARLVPTELGGGIL